MRSGMDFPPPKVLHEQNKIIANKNKTLFLKKQSEKSLNENFKKEIIAAKTPFFILFFSQKHKTLLSFYSGKSLQK